eukprot:scaffold46260_cov24-Tisochrysis_lutea.AAC.3
MHRSKRPEPGTRVQSSIVTFCSASMHDAKEPPPAALPIRQTSSSLASQCSHMEATAGAFLTHSCLKGATQQWLTCLDATRCTRCRAQTSTSCLLIL